MSTDGRVSECFEKALDRGPTTIQITCAPTVQRWRIEQLVDEFASKGQGRGWLVGRANLAREAKKFPDPLRNHIDDLLRDWFRPPHTNDKLILGLESVRRGGRTPALLLLDASSFPAEQRTLEVKGQVRDLANRQTELALWIVFVLDSRVASLNPSVASEPDCHLELR